MSDIKEFTIGYLTALVNGYERLESSYVSISTVIAELKGLLTAVEDMNREPDTTELEDILGPEELLDVMCHMRKTMAQDSKDFILQRFMKEGK